MLFEASDFKHALKCRLTYRCARMGFLGKLVVLDYELYNGSSVKLCKLEGDREIYIYLEIREAKKLGPS